MHTPQWAKCAVWVSVLGVAACQHLPHQKMMMDSAQQVKQRVTVASSSAATECITSKPSASPITWQGWVQDAELAQLIQTAVQHNVDYKMALQRLTKAQQLLEQKNASLLPSLQGQVGLTQTQTAGDSATWTQPDWQQSRSAQLGLALTSFELDFWGKLKAQQHVVEAQKQASAWALRTAYMLMVANVADAYVSLQYDMALAQLYTQQITGLERNVALNKARLTKGLISAGSVRQAEMLLRTTQNGLKDVEQRVHERQTVMGMLLGDVQWKMLQPALGTEPRAAILPTTPSYLARPIVCLAGRPDILAAEADLAAAGANVDAVRAARLPSISLTGMLSLSTAQWGALWSAHALKTTLGLNATHTVFDAGKLKKGVDIAQSDAQLALLSYEKTWLAAIKEWLDMQHSADTLTQKIEIQRQLVMAATQNTRIAEARFKAGLDSYLPVIDAQQKQITAEQQLLLLQQQSIRLYITLYRVLGDV